MQRLYTFPMRIALVHELLTMKGGAERVLRTLGDIFPDAPIYTLLYNRDTFDHWFPKDRIHTPRYPAPYNLLPAPYRYNHHFYLSQFPYAVEQWDFSAFDLVISSSSAFVHGIITNSQPKHLCYVHSPARYLWDRTHDVLEQRKKGVFGTAKYAYASRLFHKLRLWDAESADRPDKLLAASREVQTRIKKYWRRESDVVHPPMDDFWLQQNPTTHNLIPRTYYLIVSTLVPYKRIEIAIEACNQRELPLKIAGTGPHRKHLQHLAGPTIELLGQKTDEELRELYMHAIATLFPGEEDFGLVPLESMACGTPVIAYKGGGVLETVVEGQTGTFFEESTAESLAKTLQEFSPLTVDPETCRARALEFSREQFEQNIRSAIASL